VADLAESEACDEVESHQSLTTNADARLKPFSYGGQSYMMAPNALLFQPPSEVPVGVWNRTAECIDPAAGLMPGCPYDAICYLGRTFLLLSGNELLDWDTQEVLGVCSSPGEVKRKIVSLGAPAPH